MEDSHRWAHVTPNDHSGALYIITFVGFTYGGLTFITRLMIKWHVLGLDDLAMLVAQVASITQFALLLASLSAGLAKSFDTITEQEYSRMSSTYAGSQITVYITLGFSKLASILLVRRLFIRDMKSAWAICNIITILVIVWTIVSAMLISVGCKLDSLSPKNPSDICSGLQARYLFVVITDAMTDLVLSFIPTYLCRHLQMDMNFKLQVLGIFALRLPVLALAGLFFKAWVDSTHSNNYGVDRTTSLIYQQCQLCCSLIAATVPCLKSFIQSFDTGSGQKAGFGSSSRSGTYGHMSSVRHSTVQVHEGEDYEMSRLDDNQRRKSRLGHLGSNQQAIRVNRKKSTDVDSVSEVTLGLRRTSTQESDRRSQQSTQELVIRKEVQFVVRHEPAKGTETHQPGQLRLPK